MMTAPSLIRLSARAAARLRRFVNDTEASLTVEAVLVLPFFLQFYVSMFAFYDVFRTAAINEKAAYTISDVISRRNAGAPIDTAYVNWLNDLFDYMLEGRGATWIRVTSVTFDSIDNRYEVEWSRGTNGQPDLTTADLVALAPKLPVMPGGDTVVLVETDTRFGVGYGTPAWSSNHMHAMFGALGNQQLNTFIYTRPRFAPRIEFTS
jgi:hypothetical protein